MTKKYTIEMTEQEYKRYRAQQEIYRIIAEENAKYGWVVNYKDWGQIRFIFCVDENYENGYCHSSTWIGFDARPDIRLCFCKQAQNQIEKRIPATMFVEAFC